MNISILTIVVLLLYAIVPALILYGVVRLAVRHGIRDADRDRAQAAPTSGQTTE